MSGMILAGKYNLKELAIIILPFIVFNDFFNYKGIVENQTLIGIISLLKIIFFIFCLPTTRIFNDKISTSVKWILYLLVGSILVGMIVSGQNITGGLTFTSHALCLCAYFWFIKYKISSRSMIQALWILVALYAFFLIYSLTTFPNHVFGYSESSIENSEGSLAQRGVIRLAVPGSEFVICAIFFVLNLRYTNKKYLLLLIPLFVLLALRGTRTPLFLTIALSVCYLVWHNKYRVYIIVAGTVLLVLTYSAILNSFLNSQSDNIIVKYVQLTNAQLNESDEENIRVRMAKYYFFDFNENIVQVLIGNGVPSSSSEYGRAIQYNKDFLSYYLSDVSYPLIYIYYGILGLVLYMALLYNVIRTKVSPRYEFAKLFVLYYFIVSLTGGYLVVYSMYMTIGLYLIAKNRIRKNVVPKNIKQENI